MLTKEKIIQKVEEAFADVKLGEGVGLWQAEAMDNYKPENIQKEERAKDIKDDWRKISLKDLQSCCFSPCYFDAEGMRFHLPAFIIADLKGQTFNTVDSLTELSDYRKSQFSALNKQQIEVIIIYLNWSLDQHMRGQKHHHNPISRSIVEYWEPRLRDLSE